MVSFARATRASKKGKNDSNSSTFTPAKGVVITPAVKKLLSETGWTMRGSSAKKTEIHYTPEKVQPPVVQSPLEAEMFSDASSSEGEEDDNEYCRFITEVQAVKDLFHESAVCRQCKKGGLKVEFKSYLLGTSIVTKCSNCFTQCSSDVQRTTIPSTSHLQLSDYAVNCLFVLAMMLSGDGGTEAAKILGLLDLPRSASIDRSAFPTVETVICREVISLTEKLLDNNLKEEVRNWSKSESQDFDQIKWEDARQNDKPIAFDDMPSVTVFL